MFAKIVFENDDEKQQFDKYMSVRGKFQYLQFYKILTEDKVSISYSEFSSCLRYDKNLRDTLYIYLATFEEYLKALIFDKYDIDQKEDFKNKSAEYIAAALKEKNGDEETSNLYYCFHFGLGKIIAVVKEKKMFADAAIKDFNEIRCLRNRVAHHNVLIAGEAETLKEMLTNKEKIKKEIESLARRLPSDYRDNFIKKINSLPCVVEDYKIRVALL